MSINRAFDFVIIASHGDSLVRFRGELLRQVRALGKTVLALAPEFSTQVRADLEALGVAQEELPMSRTGTNLKADLQLLYCLGRRIREIQPEVVLGYTVKPVVYGSLACLGTSARRYALITGLGYAFTDGVGDRRGVRLAVTSLYRVALAAIDGAIFQNPDDLAFFRNNRLLRSAIPAIVVGGSGIDLEKYAETPVPDGPISFLLIARLLGDKGVREFVAALRILKADHPQVVAKLVGWIDSNPDAISPQELQAWTDEGVVEHLGRLDDVRPAIAACSVYVLPSYREGTPRSVLESMAMGRAIITTDAPGCRETVVDGYNGLLVAPRSVQALVEAMARFVHDPELARVMGRRSRARAEAKYDARAVTAEMLRHMGLYG